MIFRRIETLHRIFCISRAINDCSRTNEYDMTFLVKDRTKHWSDIRNLSLKKHQRERTSVPDYQGCDEHWRWQQFF